MDTSAEGRSTNRADRRDLCAREHGSGKKYHAGIDSDGAVSLSERVFAQKGKITLWEYKTPYRANMRVSGLCGNIWTWCAEKRQEQTSRSGQKYRYESAGRNVILESILMGL